MPKQITRTIYVAEDGAEFATEPEAQFHELSERIYNSSSLYLQKFQINSLVSFLLDRYTLTPKPAAELLSEDPDHGDGHAN
jgi:hypothetical protein